MLGRLAMNLGVDPLSLVTWRTLFAVGLIFPALLLFRRRLLLIPLRSVPLFALLGLCQAVNFVAFFQAVARLEVGVAVSLFYVYPVLATVLAWAALREPFSLQRGLALASAAAGALLVSGLGQGTGSLSLAGIAWCLLAATSYAVYVLLMKVSVRGHPPARVLACSLAFTGLLLLVQPLGSRSLFTPHPIRAWGVIALLALGPTLPGYSLFAAALKRIDLGTASILSTLEPGLASLLAFAVLGERLGPLQIVGLVLIVSGAAIAQGRDVRRGRRDRLP